MLVFRAGSFSRAAVLLGLGIYAGSLIGAGQQPASSALGLSARPLAQDSATAEGLLHLDAVVTDSTGKLVTDLKEEDFTLLDAGQPTRIVSFRAFKPGSEAKEPAPRVLFVIDTLNNGFTELAYMRQGLERFLLQNGGHLVHPTSLLLFTKDGIQPVAGPSTDGSALAAAVSKMNPRVRPRGLSQFFLSLQALASIAQSERQRPGRKLVIWLGQGWPYPAPPETQYTMTDQRDQAHEFSALVTLTDSLRDARITLYGGYEGGEYFYRDYLKGVKKSSLLNAASMSLDVLAIRTGGRGNLPNMNRDSSLDAQLNEMIADADSYYSLSFDPPATDHADDYRDLKLVLQRPGLTAHTIAGYYDEPSYRVAKQNKIAERAPAPAEPPSPKLIRKAVTVAQLENLASTLKRSADGAAADQVNGVKLTERLSTQRLPALESMMPGERARAALVGIGDESQFLPVPADEVVAQAMPDLAAQKKMVSNVVSYLGNTIPKLPNFFAAQKTVHYEDTPARSFNKENGLTGGQAWRIAGRRTAIVQYRDGKEVTNPEGRSARKEQPERGLITRGTFGPILSMAIVDASHGEMTFDHWEKGQRGVEAVFKYKVPESQSHYTVAFQSPTADEAGEVPHSAYHGEIAIDPASGAILRIALIADLGSGGPIARGDVMVEYAPVEIGGKSYMCPSRSVSVSVGQSGKLEEKGKDAAANRAVSRTLMNDVTFTDYHVFRSEIRIITGDEPAVNPK